MYLLSQFPDSQQQHKKVFHITCGSEFDIGIGHNRIPFISCPIPPPPLSCLSVYLHIYYCLNLGRAEESNQATNSMNPDRAIEGKNSVLLIPRLHCRHDSCLISDTSFLFFSSWHFLSFASPKLRMFQKCLLHFLCCYCCRWFRCSHIYSQAGPCYQCNERDTSIL